MTQEEKQLLLVDLCGRLPYGVSVKYKSRKKEGVTTLGYGNIYYVNDIEDGWLSECKPYLRPISSMTEEERLDLNKKTGAYLSTFITPKIKFPLVDEFGEYECYCNEDWKKVFDWLNAHHFDYRGLIERGLALEAKEDMYRKEVEK